MLVHFRSSRTLCITEISLSPRILTPAKLALVLTLYRQVPDRTTTGVPFVKSLVSPVRNIT